MRRRRLVGTASAVTMATLATAVTAWAEPAVPTFAGGLSQPVFAQGSANWVNHELWVETDMDTDADGRLDRVHVDVSRPTETETDGLKVPVVYEDSPYYAGGADITNWNVDHEIGQPPASRPRAPYFPADVRFRQSIGAREGLRTGVYSQTLTFTLSTTQP